MIFHKAKIAGLYIIELEPKGDERGRFTRIFCKKELAEANLNFMIVQVNQSWNRHKGIIRGLHFQKEPKAEDKIVGCLEGAIYDVAVDLREDSPSYGEWQAVELSRDNMKMFYIPKGCAHGFQALTDNCLVQYFMSEFYSPEHERGVRYDDPLLNIKWPLDNPILLAKDKSWPPFKKK